VRLAAAMDLEVHVAHVEDPDAPDGGLATRARYADAVHHEYPAQLDEVVRGGLPGCAPEECRRITDVALCRGDVAAELSALIERTRPGVLVAGWHGRLRPGRARVLGHLVREITCPVLLVKPAVRAPFRLDVGEALE
jgi:hypothetical protein